jgi:hypothetical protein
MHRFIVYSLIIALLYGGIISLNGRLVLAEEDFMNEEDAIDDPVPIGGSGGTETRDTQQEDSTVDFKNGDKGCDNNHQNCQHYAKHNSNSNNNNNDSPMTKLINGLPNGCMIVKEPTTTERVAGFRTTIEITCEGQK